MIKAVMLDVDNTLFDFHASANISMMTVAKEEGIDVPEDLPRIFHTFNDQLWSKVERAEMDAQELYDTRWDTIFGRLGIDYDGKLFERKFKDKIGETAVLMEHADELVRYIGSKYPTYVASNASQKQQQGRLKLHDLDKYIKRYFTSIDIGIAKPEKGFYEECLRCLSPLKPEEILMLGDSYPADIHGAHVFGITTCWYNNAGCEVPENCCADYIIHSHLEAIKLF